ncbi:TPA: hypothetical protein DCX15_06500 [bacterium]|nr:hypothetical protein [bacterium]
MVTKEFDLLEDRVLSLINKLKTKTIGPDPTEIKELKTENRELKKKMELLKTRINRMLKQLDRIERQVE